jgi:hypothetical protein
VRASFNVCCSPSIAKNIPVEEEEEEEEGEGEEANRY